MCIIVKLENLNMSSFRVGRKWAIAPSQNLLKKEIGLYAKY
jgi:hypothetical protein